MWLCMLELLLWHLWAAPSQIWSLLLAHWSWDKKLLWSVSVAEVLWLRQSLHPQAPAGCHGWICNDICRISDTSVYMIHMQLCSLGDPVDWSCIKQSGWLNLSCSISQMNRGLESVPDCEILSLPPIWLCFLDQCSSILNQLYISCSTDCDKGPHQKISPDLRYDTGASRPNADEQYQLHPDHHYIQRVKSSGTPFFLQHWLW